MRGSPLFRAVIAFLALLALAIPLRRLTGGRAEPPPEATPAATAAQEIELQLTFTMAPASFRVSSLGKVLWSENAEGKSQWQRKFSLPVPSQGIDLLFHVEFPEGAPLSALRVQLTDPRGDLHEKSLWGVGRIDDVLGFP